MRETYLICQAVLMMFNMLAAMLTPIYVTPGWYFWTAFFIIVALLQGSQISNRIDEWNAMDRLKNLGNL